MVSHTLLLPSVLNRKRAKLAFKEERDVVDARDRYPKTFYCTKLSYKDYPWSSIADGDEGTFWPECVAVDFNAKPKQQRMVTKFV